MKARRRLSLFVCHSLCLFTITLGGVAKDATVPTQAPGPGRYPGGPVVSWENGLTPPPGLTAINVAAEGGVAMALKPDGTVVSWGSNNFGQTNVPPGLANVV